MSETVAELSINHLQFSKDIVGERVQLSVYMVWCINPKENFNKNGKKSENLKVWYGINYFNIYSKIILDKFHRFFYKFEILQKLDDLGVSK